MTQADETAHELRSAIFDSGALVPDPVYLELFATFMRWPVDAFALRSASDNKRIEHHVTWAKGRVIGVVSYVDALDGPQVTAAARRVDAVTDVELGARVYDEGLKPTSRPSMTLRFAAGDPITVDVAQLKSQAHRERAEGLIAYVLDTMGR